MEDKEIGNQETRAEENHWFVSKEGIGHKRGIAEEMEVYGSCTSENTYSE